MRPARLLLVHGAFHGAWCWQQLIHVLSARGVEAEAIELPLTSLADDGIAVADAIERAGRPVVVVGHSYGGAVVTAGAGGGKGRPPAMHLVYLAALMPDHDDPDELKETPGMSAIRRAEDGTAYVDPDRAAAAFYHRCPTDKAAWAVTQLRQMPFSTLAESSRPEAVAWRTVPSTYIVCTDDHMVDPGDQRRLATRAGRCFELDADHSPFLSRREELAHLLVETALSVTNP